MSPDTDFLTAVLPDHGTYCVTGIDNEGTTQNVFVDDIESIEVEARKFVDQKVNAFFALATYDKDEQGGFRRKQVNAHWVKSFWIDVDCGEGKPYPDQVAGLEALHKFQEDTGLPDPFIVNSGNGLHVYWLLTEYVSTEQWRPVARKLKAACKKYDFDVDRSVMSDSARILRIPNTFNFKNPDNPKEVVVDQRGETISIEDFETILDSLDLPAQRVSKSINVSNMSETAKALIGNKTSKFKKLVRKSLNDKGCNAIKHIVLDQENVEEPLWRAGLSIAWACEDGEEAIHLMSKKHPDYDPDDTREKASLTLGPYTCETISEIDPSLCEGCTQTCTSPIQLGSEIRRDTSELFSAPESEPESDGSLPTQVVQQALYKPPFPYFRAANGGIYRQEGSGDDAAEVPVYEHDLYPIKRIHDPNDGESVVFRHHLPQDGIREFTIPLKKLMAADSFRDFMGEQGVAGTTNQMKEIMNYSIRFTKELQKLHKAHEARLQFGWSHDKESFIVGNRAYVKNKPPQHNPASSTTADLIDFFTPRGSLEEWRQAVDVLARPGMEPLQLAFGAGFGAPLMEFTGLSGCTLNLISNKSGTGKSTAGYLALSIFGNPKETALIAEDTHLAKLHRIGVMNNLAVMSDEMTNIAPDLLSNMLYSISQGRARHRMEKDKNRERKNISSWRTIFLTNSNASMMSKLSKAKARPDGEMMRLLEMHVDRVEVENADVIFDKMNSNYGVAGEVYAQWLVDNRDRIPEMYDRQCDKLYRTLGKRMEERFWVKTMAVDILGLRIGQSLSLNNFDLDGLEQFVCRYLISLREEVKTEVVDAANLVGEFLMDHSNAILAVGNRINPRSGDNVWMPARSAKMVARFELEGNLMYIAKKAFREYCVDRQFTEAEALKDSQQDGSSYQYLRTTKKRMMSGTPVVTPGVDAHVFKCSPEESAEIFKLIERDTLEAEAEEGVDHA
jgi:hypothetical protein